MAETKPDTPEPSREQATPEPGRRSSPLPWILLLLALIVFGWFVYEQRAGVTDRTEPLPLPSVVPGDAQDAAAERERAADDARRQGRERDRRSTAPTSPATTDTGPAVSQRVQPEYPASAYRDRAEGTVLVGVLVGADGRPVEVDVVERSGNRELDRAAVDAVRQWTFDPAVRDGSRVEARVEVPVAFRIDEQ